MLSDGSAIYQVLLRSGVLASEARLGLCRDIDHFDHLRRRVDGSTYGGRIGHNEATVFCTIGDRA